MNDIILRKAQARIDAKRQLAEEVARNNLQIAYSHPKFKEFYRKQKELEIELARCQAYDEPFDMSELENLFTQQELILKEVGLNGIDLKPNYECKYCDDTGYVKGKLCSCLKKEINKELYAYSGFTEKLMRFEDDTVKHPAYDIMQKWCDTKSDKTNVLISGPTGTGKTFLTQCIASRLMEKNKLVLFTTAFNLNNSMLNYHISFASNRESIISPFMDSEVLIIDDLGSEPLIKNVTKEYLYLIINERMLRKLPTIITTNLTLNEIMATYGERILSRLANRKTSIFINLDGDDLRMNIQDK